MDESEGELTAWHALQEELEQARAALSEARAVFLAAQKRMESILDKINNVMRYEAGDDDDDALNRLRVFLCRTEAP